MIITHNSNNVNSKEEKTMKNCVNCEIRTKIRENRLAHWEVAKKMGISEFTLCRWLRQELNARQLEMVETAIEALKREENHA